MYLYSCNASLYSHLSFQTKLIPSLVKIPSGLLFLTLVREIYVEKKYFDQIAFVLRFFCTLSFVKNYNRFCTYLSFYSFSQVLPLYIQCFCVFSFGNSECIKYVISLDKSLIVFFMIILKIFNI